MEVARGMAMLGYVFHNNTMLADYARVLVQEQS
jgi:hypothetical protein